MKHNFFRIGLALTIMASVMVLLTMGSLKKPAISGINPAGNGFAVIELFTSEGCSSCPPADAAVEKLSVLHPDDVYVVSFHVDYWDHLGWKDEFSDAAYSKRQRGYGDHFNLSSVYTPQVVVNGKEQFVGSDAKKLMRTVDNEINITENQPIQLTAAVSAGKTVQVMYKFENAVNASLNFVLVQMAAQTNVKKGENEGRALRHINIVRDFTTERNARQTGTANLTLPNGIRASQSKVIVYLQDLKTSKVLGVASTIIL